MATATYIVGDTRDVLTSLPDGSVDLVLTSPPFLALRSYLPADHPDKDKEIGSEPTPAEFLQTLLDLTAEWRRVLAPHGSIAIELGDTYSGSGGGGGDYLPGGLRDGQPGFTGSASRGRDANAQRAANAAHWRLKNAQRAAWPLDKSLCLLPTLYPASLAYGRNLLTGEPSPAGQWRVRNLVVWARPNPPVGELGDKVRPATSYLTIATIAKDRYFDLDAVRQVNNPDRMLGPSGGRPNMRPGLGNRSAGSTGGECHPGGAPPLDWWEPLPEEQALWDQWADELWEIPTAPYKGAHYATWPPMLCVRPIKMMCPEKVCRVCGGPSRRITENHTAQQPSTVSMGKTFAGGRANSRGNVVAGTGRVINNAAITTTGWSDCGHDDWRPGLILDPFAGSGTTLAVATGHGRDAIGIDLDEKNVVLAEQRVGMFLKVVNHARSETKAS